MGFHCRACTSMETAAVTAGSDPSCMNALGCCWVCQVRELHASASADWERPGQPGWGIYKVHTDDLLLEGVLESVFFSSATLLRPSRGAFAPALRQS